MGGSRCPFINNAAIVQLRLDRIVLWGAAILLFLAGVRRGLSFRDPEWRDFVPDRGLDVVFHRRFRFPCPLGFGSKAPAMLLLLLGYASLIVFDVRASRNREAPPFSPACGRARR